ncbi:helix-turn-helix protein [Mumia flava]|uniref:Helix-turn-helix protein n=1 Tax=Mumia flava TaxID=1348852 RepID=A0A0B2B9A2_9ACTN|nr:metalloregulator ArsR/SmtB family transcription factor [Mumia flava]PJJ53505.1 helix-turn-helix protein [Mumia flava]
MSMTPIVLDARTLKALAHPLRVQVVGTLRRFGPSTATQLAERLGVSSAAVSYHVRQLAAAGLVVDVPERGNARERWWKAAHDVTVADTRTLDEDDPDALDAYLRSIATAITLRIQQVLGARSAMPPEWRSVTDLSDFRARLTPAQTEELTERLHAVAEEYVRQHPESEAGPDAEMVSFDLQVLPDLDVGDRS